MGDLSDLLKTVIAALILMNHSPHVVLEGIHFLLP